jgi:hypothetical protein
VQARRPAKGHATIADSVAAYSAQLLSRVGTTPSLFHAASQSLAAVTARDPPIGLARGFLVLSGRRAQIRLFWIDVALSDRPTL